MTDAITIPTRSEVKLKPALLVLGLAILAACGGGNDAVSGIETLGAVFQQAFAQGANDVPADVANANLVVNKTAEAFEL